MKKYILAILVLVLGLALWSCVDNLGSSDEDTHTGHHTEYHEEESHDVGHAYKEYHFRSDSKLDDHYYKHGRYMGFDDPEAYEKAACDVINNPDALVKTEAEDGDYVYYVEDTNEFVVLSTDGYIRTYFEPDAGKRYFDKQ